MWNMKTKTLAAFGAVLLTGCAVALLLVRGAYGYLPQEAQVGWMLRGWLLIALLLVVSAVSVALFVRAIIGPLREVAGAAGSMAEGDLHVAERITYGADDEIGLLAASQRLLSERMSGYIASITRDLHTLASGDLRIEAGESFVGEFLPIQESLLQLSASFNRTIGKLDDSAAQVEASSAQVAQAAQELSQNAAVQADHVDQLARAVDGIAQHVRSTADAALHAREDSDAARAASAACSTRIEEMTGAMQDISRSSGEIGKILKTIEDIAFQTNILALNAAVEAARAGAAGKGFAVVADEVRNLANKSAEASKGTARMMESTVTAVGHGEEIVQQTVQALAGVIGLTEQVSQAVSAIAAASSEQAAEVGRAAEGIGRISESVQASSAAVEEAASVSERLSGQAHSLKAASDSFVRV